MERTAGNQMTIKENNQNLIIDTLIRRGATSRADLAKLLKLSAPSISNNINQLLKKRLLLEIGSGDSIGGRRPILLNFNFQYGYIVGVDLSGQDLKIALSNLKPEVIELRTVGVANERDGHKILGIIIGQIVDLFAANNLPLKQLQAITVGFPGVFNEEIGRLVLLPLWLYVWDKIDLREELQKQFKVRVIIKNDINLAALGESRFGVGRDYRNLAYVSVDMGVGAGVIINNQLYEGMRLAAGEIGYFASRAADLSLDHANCGPLESRISIPSIVRRIKKDLGSGALSRISELVRGDFDQIDATIIETALLLKDPYIIELMAEVQKELGIILANIGILLDLELIVLGGKLFEINPGLAETFQTMVGKLAPIQTKVTRSSLDHPVVYGAFAAALDAVYANLLNLK